jgi:hypothetical protein
MRLPDGGFASAQDSESEVDGSRVEGGYYALDAAARARQAPPALDDKVLTGWNGLAIGALASAGARGRHPEWVDAAVGAADLLAGEIARARIGSRISGARPTLEDFGMLADGLLDVALATGEARHAVRARELVTATLTGTGTGSGSTAGFAAPGGPDPVLAAHGLALEVDPSEGAYPSGLSAVARAAARLASLGGGGTLRAAASGAMGVVAPLAVQRPMSFGASLGVMSLVAAPARELVVVTDDPDAELASVARAWRGGVVAVVTAAQAGEFAASGFELFEGRDARGGEPTAYLCENFVCQLPVTDPATLRALVE